MLGLGAREDGAVRPQKEDDDHRHADDEAEYACHRERVVLLIIGSVTAHAHVRAQIARPVAELHARERHEYHVRDRDVESVHEEDRGVRGALGDEGDATARARALHEAGYEAEPDDANGKEECGTQMPKVVLLDEATQRRDRVYVQADGSEDVEHEAVALGPVTPRGETSGDGQSRIPPTQQ